MAIRLIPKSLFLGSYLTLEFRRCRIITQILGLPSILRWPKIWENSNYAKIFPTQIHCWSYYTLCQTTKKDLKQKSLKNSHKLCQNKIFECYQNLYFAFQVINLLCSPADLADLLNSISPRLTLQQKSAFLPPEHNRFWKHFEICIAKNNLLCWSFRSHISNWHKKFACLPYRNQGLLTRHDLRVQLFAK